MKDLLAEARDLYQEIKSIYRSTAYETSYFLNTFWANENMKDMLMMINGSSSAQEAIHSAQRTWMFSVNTSDPVKKKGVTWLLDNQKKSGLNLFDLDSSVQESPFSNPENNVVVAGRILTPDFLRTISIASEIKKYCLIPDTKFRVLELGAGLGHLARTLRLFVPNISHTIIDIPETLFFSFMFLKLNFPEAKIFYVTSQEQLSEISTEEYDFVFIPTMFAESCLEHKFDIFINTASLGEMKNDIIKYWMDFVQNKLDVRYLFTLNRYLNTIIPDGRHDWRLDENECSVLYDSDWKIIQWEVEPPYTRCPYVDTIIARYVEIVAERNPLISTVQKKEKSRELLLDVMDEDWVRRETSPPELSCRDNILVNDMTMQGTLFKLWDSIRLDPNEQNVMFMLKYLETLMHRQGKEFEEVFYYEKLFERLFTSKNNPDLQRIKQVIDLKRKHRKNLQSSVERASYLDKKYSPILAESNYYGFNIIHYKDKFYALAQTLGQIDLTQLDEHTLNKYQAHGQCFIANSFHEIRKQVDQLTPVLVQEGYQGFNIVDYRGKFYGLAQTLGAIDLTQLDDDTIKQFQLTKQLVVDNSLDEVKRLIIQRDYELLQAELIDKTEETTILQHSLKNKSEELATVQHELDTIKYGYYFRMRNMIKRFITRP